MPAVRWSRCLVDSPDRHGLMATDFPEALKCTESDELDAESIDTDRICPHLSGDLVSWLVRPIFFTKI